MCLHLSGREVDQKLSQKDMLQMGELTEVKNIRHETEFMMKDFRNRKVAFSPEYDSYYDSFLLLIRITH